MWDENVGLCLVSGVVNVQSQHWPADSLPPALDSVIHNAPVWPVLTKGVLSHFFFSLFEIEEHKIQFNVIFESRPYLTWQKSYGQLYL